MARRARDNDEGGERIFAGALGHCAYARAKHQVVSAEKGNGNSSDPVERPPPWRCNRAAGLGLTRAHAPTDWRSALNLVWQQSGPSRQRTDGREPRGVSPLAAKKSR
eukprot:7387363-Prymnesium_polylepis.1